MGTAVKPQIDLTATDKTRAAFASVLGNLGDINRRLGSVQGSMDELGRKGGLVGKALSAAFAAVVSGAAYTKFVTETAQANAEQAQLAAVIKSTGQAAGWTAEQLNAMAQRMSGSSVFSAGEITQAQTRLLSYTNIVGEQFPAALQAAIDMASRMGMDVTQAAETVGRALDVPSQGLTALTRQGFRFSDAQKEQVEALEESGRTAQAQKMILDALTSSYGGAATAARDTLGGALAALRNTVQDLFTGSGAQADQMKEAIERINGALSSGEAAEGADTIKQALADLATIVADLVEKFRGAGGFEIAAKAVTIALQTLLVVGANVAFVFQGVGREIGAIAAQLAALARLDFKAFTAISDMVKEDAERARAELDAFEQRVMNVGSGRTTVQAPAEEGKPAKTAAGTTGGSGGETAAKAKARLDAALKIYERSVQREGELAATRNRFLDAYNTQGLLSLADYYARRRTVVQEAADAQAAAYDKEIAALRAYQARVAKQEDKATAEDKIRELIEKRTDLRRKAAEDLQMLGIEEKAAADKLAKEIADGMTQVDAELARAAGRSGEAAAAELRKRYAKLRKDLAATGNTDGLLKIEKLVDIEAARAQLQDLQSQIDRVFGAQSREQQAVQAEMAAGVTTQYAGQQRLLDINARTAAQVEALLPRMRELAEITGDPEIAAGLAELETRVGSLKLRTDELKVAFENAFQEGFSDAITDLITQTESLGDALRNFGAAMAESMARFAANKLAEQATDALMDGLTSAAKAAQELIPEFARIATAKAAADQAMTVSGATATATTVATQTAAAGTVAAASAPAAAATATWSWGAAAIAGLAALAALYALAKSGFARGGYTGDGGKWDPAGVVHAGEWVLPQDVVRQRGAKRFLAQFQTHGMSLLRGFADGGLVPGDLPAYRPTEGPAAGAGGAQVNNRMRVYLLQDENQLMQRLAQHPAMEKAVVAIAGQNGGAIRAEW